MWVYMARHGFKVSVSNFRSDLMLRPHLKNIGSYVYSLPGSACCRRIRTYTSARPKDWDLRLHAARNIKGVGSYTSAMPEDVGTYACMRPITI
jgi:hypothetical protein